MASYDIIKSMLPFLLCSTVHCTRIHFSRPIFDHIAFVIPHWYKYTSFFSVNFTYAIHWRYIYIQAQLESHGVEYKQPQPRIRTHNAQCLCTSSKRYKKNTTILFIYIFAWIELCTWCAVDCLFFVFFLAFMQRSQSAISYMCQ